MIYAYCRVSKPTQKIERQIRNVTEWFIVYRIQNQIAQSELKIYQDKYTGTKMKRPYWERLYKVLKTGDIVVFDSVSRMSRNAEEGIEAYMELYNKGIQLYFLKEPMINTEIYRKALDSRIQIQKDGMDSKTVNLIESIESALNEFMHEIAREQILLAFQQAEKEVKDLQRNTSEGMRKAVEEHRVGVHKGEHIITYKSLYAKLAILKYSKFFYGNLKDTETMLLIVDKNHDNKPITRKTYYKYKKELLEMLETETIETVKSKLEQELAAMKERKKL